MFDTRQLYKLYAKQLEEYREAATGGKSHSEVRWRALMAYINLEMAMKVFQELPEALKDAAGTYKKGVEKGLEILGEASRNATELSNIGRPEMGLDVLAHTKSTADLLLSANEIEVDAATQSIDLLIKALVCILERSEERFEKDFMKAALLLVVGLYPGGEAVGALHSLADRIEAKTKEYLTTSDTLTRLDDFNWLVTNWCVVAKLTIDTIRNTEGCRDITVEERLKRIETEIQGLFEKTSLQVTKAD